MSKIKWVTSVAAAALLAAGLAKAQPQAPSFAQMDKDKNGSLSKDEVAAFFAERGAAGGGGGPGGAAGGRAGGEGGRAGAGAGGGRGGPPDAAQIFARWDANGDGKVTQQEFDARPRGGGGGQRPQN